MTTEDTPDLCVVARTEIEWIESLLMMANFAIGKIIANDRQKRLAPRKRSSNAYQTALNDEGGRTISECSRVGSEELF